jgi:hypothetical protein
MNRPGELQRSGAEAQGEYNQSWNSTFAVVFGLD